MTVEGRLETLDAEIARLTDRSRRFTALRLIAFLVFIAGLFGAFESPWSPVFIALPALVVFVVALFRHGAVLDRQRIAENRRLLLTEQLGRQTNRRRGRAAPDVPSDPTPLEAGLSVFAPEGESFPIDAGVTDDLEILSGPRNLFSFLDVSSTIFGARRLRYLLTHPLRRATDIRRRQEAVTEVAQANEHRERVLESLVTLRGTPLDDLPRSLYEPATFANRRWLLVTAHVLGTAAPALLIASVFWPWLIGIAFLIIVVNLGIVGANVRHSNPARDRLLAFGPLLRGLVDLEVALEAAEPRSDAWKDALTELRSMRPAAARLGRYVTLLQLHSFGIVFEILNIALLWELRLLPPAEKLFATHRDVIERSTGALGETEALLSLACPLAEQEGFSLPEAVSADRPIIEARAMAHPLLESTTVVRNDLEMRSGGDDVNVIVLTGSNMAGKSTWLKATGVNALLAGAGGPVCAASFRWTPVALFTDINVRDSLDDGKSYFQVEVERVRETIRAAGESPLCLAIFDELFRGTNADERLALARSILRFLRDHGILLLVATHDNALTRLVTDDAEAGMANFHLREAVRGKEMTFDYRVRPGPATTRNAIKVLEVSGYPEEITAGARQEMGPDGGPSSA